MDIQIAVRSAGLDADQSLHAVIVSVFAPALQHVEFLERIYMVHLKEADAGRNLTVGFDLTHTDIRQPFSEILHFLAADHIRHKGIALLFLHVHEVVNALEELIVLNDCLTGIGKLFDRLHHQECSKAVQGLCIVDIFGQDLSFKDGRIRHEDHIMRFGNGALARPSGSCTVLHTGAQDIGQFKEDIAHFDLVCGHITRALVLGPHMGEPAHALPVLQ